MVVNNQEDLGKAINSNTDEIIIKGDLAKKIIIIKTKGKLAWFLALSFVAIVIIVIAKSDKPSAVAVDNYVAKMATSSAVSIWGIAATVTAVCICLSTKSVTTLKELRNNYEIVEKCNDSLRLRRKRKYENQKSEL